MLMAAILGVAAISFCGCKTAEPSSNHIWQIGGTATKAGLVQDPVTRQYSLGLQRIQVVNTVIPVRVVTNSTGEQHFIVPDVVSSYEVTGRNSVFGGVGLTQTMATGTNAVRTTLGGAHEPINAGDAK